MKSKNSSLSIVINNGRVMDPLTLTDVAANVGIKDGKIATIVPIEQKVIGDRVIDAAGLVVAPGFINIHGHEGIIEKTMEVALLDGVTTTIGGNCGSSPYPLDEYLENLERRGMCANYAAYTGHITLREAVGVTDKFASAANSQQLTRMLRLVEQEMKDGALGVSFAPFYGPGSTYEEMLAMAKKCAELDGSCAIHVRHSWPAPDPTGKSVLCVAAVKEGIQLARDSGAPFIISHLGGPTYGDGYSGMALELILKGMEEGLKLAADVHPYNKFSTFLTAPVFTMMPMEQLLSLVDAKPTDLQVRDTVMISGKVFMKALETFASVEQFDFVRNRALAGEIADPGVLGEFYRPQKTMLWMSAPFVMVENDGAIRVDPATGKYSAHPRIAGTYSRFLGYWVRERGVCDLMTALSKTSTMAAVWLGLNNKGRIQVGRDADLVLFDPEEIVDTATYDPEGCLNPPIGIPYVIVNGLIAVDNGKLTGEKAGRAIRRKWNIPGVLPKLGRLPGKEINVLGSS